MYPGIGIWSVRRAPLIPNQNLIVVQRGCTCKSRGQVYHELLHRAGGSEYFSLLGGSMSLVEENSGFPEDSARLVVQPMEERRRYVERYHS